MTDYEEIDSRTFKVNAEGERLLLANFTARITRETRLVDGVNSETYLTLTGFAANPKNVKQPVPLPEVEIPASQFAGMQWVMNAWGVRAVIQPGSGVKDDLRTAIQMQSSPTTKTIYRAIGWHMAEGQRAYLHAGGAITAKGNDRTVTVRLPVELSRYNLATDKNAKDGFLASVFLAGIMPMSVGWTLWAATYAPLFGPVDFAVHLTGRSGTFKSELVSLFQSHYGDNMDARHLPGSWSSTPNALEAQAFFAANAIFVVDDFVPTGTSWQVRAYQTAADKLIRAQGNQAGRARLTDSSGLQQTYYPRGLILSTGEDTPEGHSVRARMMICELSPGDIRPQDLTKAQESRHLLPAAVAELVRCLAGKNIDLQRRQDQLRNEHIEIGHTRTPPMMGRLIATGEAVLTWAGNKGWITKKDAQELAQLMADSILLLGKQQARYIEQADPVEIFFGGLRQAMNSGLAHLRTINGGIPRKATTLGWTNEMGNGDIKTYKSHGPCVGWIDWDEDTLFLECNIGHALIKKLVGQELTLTKQTLFKRMKDAGLLVRTDEARQRNTIRVTAENHPRQVLALAASTTLEQAEVPADEEIPD